MHLPSSSPSSRLSRTSARSATGPSEHQERVWVKETRGRRRLIGLTNTPRAAISSTLDWVRILPVLKTTPHTALMINRRLYCNTETVQPGIKPELLPLIISLVGDERFAKRHQHTHTHTSLLLIFWYSAPHFLKLCLHITPGRLQRNGYVFMCTFIFNICMCIILHKSLLVTRRVLRICVIDVDTQSTNQIPL